MKSYLDEGKIVMDESKELMWRVEFHVGLMLQNIYYDDVSRIEMQGHKNRFFWWLSLSHHY